MKVICQFFVLCIFYVASEGIRVRYPTRRPYRPYSRPPPVSNIIPREKCLQMLDHGQVPQSGGKKFFRRPVCMQLNETQLLDKLKDAGGYNPRYVALNRSEACNFVDLTTDEQFLPNPTFIPRFTQPRTPTGRFQPTGTATPTRRPTTRGQSRSLNNSRLEFVHDEIAEDNIPRRQKRTVPSQPGTVRRGCWSAGSFVGNSNLKRTCTECPATTQLPPNVFPQFINEVVCDSQSGFRLACFPRIGQCYQRVLKFTFLQSTGNYTRNAVLSRLLGVDVFVEEWKTFTQDIRSCCDCRAF